MASTNFKIFAENAASDALMDDASYTADSQRQTGVAPGVALPSLHNKLYKQATVMNAAIAQCIVQAGFDAKDDDYTGLVSGIRQTFAGSVLGVTPDTKGNIDIAAEVRKIRDEKPHTYSVNGVYPDSTGNVDITEVIEEIRDEKPYVFSVNDIKPDANGNVDLTALIETIKKSLWPRVGDCIVTKNSENPSVQYPGTTWQLLGSNTFLMATQTKSEIGTTGGANTRSLTAAQMPAHTHAITCGAAGGHSHTRGTMNITGTLPLPTHTGRWDKYVTGAFWTEGGNGGAISKTVEGVDFEESSKWRDVTYSTFDAAKSWTGSTSMANNHTHTITAANMGNGEAYDTRPQYMAVYIWFRTA